MTPEQRARVEQILDALLEVLPKDRNAELDRLCSHDSETRTEVARLLSAMADNSALHEPSIAEMFKQAVNLANAAAEDMPAGTIIGSYRILENLGEGGFGSVYRAAERGDIKRVVALKVIKPGVDTKEVLARFESERQALAYMNHAGIAKLFSAGKTERGRPYFVMEYVPGIRITEFADRNRLIVTDRLRMFQQVCYAINHAHQKGIIHRDIKASNVLAFYVDGRIMAKIIDFGIAKALTGDRLTDRSFQETGSGIAIGTYESMSPEQANGDPDIDTRTDIYSLGVLLYELLVSVKPLNEKILIDANDEVIRQNICEIDAPNPSSQLLSLGASAMTIAGARQISLPDLIMMLKSELEWIPLKAMRKERERRYASVLALAEDVNNYLENRPLKAGPESLAYYMRKLCRRNRSIFLTTATFIVTLAVILSTYIYNIKAERARTVEQSTAREMEAARANQNAAIAKINAIEKSRLADKLKLQAGDSDYQLGNLLAGNHDADALAYLARALRENNANRNAVLLSIMILYRYRVPLQELRHGDFVNSAMFSPDGTRIVTASSDNTARVWDAITGKPIGLPMRHEDAVFSASFSPDGTRVVTASEDNTACVWDAAKGKLLGNAMRHEKAYVHAVFTATFSADGTRVVTAGADNTARVWNAASGKPLGEPMRHDGAVMCAMFSPDGSRVVTASLDNTARVWNATTGKLLGEPMQHNDAVFSASFSPDGMRVVTASADDTARVWNAASCKPLGEPMRHRGSVRAAAFSPDGLRVVTASFDGTACVWDAATGKALGEPMRHEDFVHSAQFSPDGIRIVTASDDNTARIWDAATGTQMGESLQHGGFVHSATFSPDGLRVVTASTDSTAQEWDVADQHPLSEPMRHGAAINSAVFSPDGKRIVTASDDKTACVWDAATGEPIGKPMQHRGSVHFATFSPDSARVVTVSDDNTAEVWDVGTGKPLGAPIRHTAPIHSAVFSPSGIRILTASDDGTARMWDAVTGRQFGESMRHDAPIFSASYSSNGKRVVTASKDGTARVWDAATGRPLSKPMRHDRLDYYAVFCAQFSPDGKRVVTAGADKTARVWDANTGNQLGESMRHGAVVTSASFSPDGMRILTVSWDRTARVWDVVTGKPVGVPMQNGRDIYSACFSPDGKYVVTSNGDNTARLWDAATGKELGEPLKHRDKITSALFSPDGTRVVTASNDHTARVWDIVLAGSVCPQWLATLDEFAAGQRFGSHGEIERLGNERQAMRADLRNRAKSLSVNELQCRWLQWFLADPRTRTISPLSDETVPEYIQRRVKENTTDSLREAIELDPNNALALARFASHLVEEKNAHQDGLEIYANLYSDLAIKLAPRDAEVLRLRQEVLDTLQKHHW